jgi:hypothetical protein
MVDTLVHNYRIPHLTCPSGTTRPASERLFDDRSSEGRLGPEASSVDVHAGLLALSLDRCWQGSGPATVRVSSWWVLCGKRKDSSKSLIYLSSNRKRNILPNYRIPHPTCPSGTKVLRKIAMNEGFGPHVKLPQEKV